MKDEDLCFVKDEDLFFLKDEDLLEVFGWMVAINPVGQVALKTAIFYSSSSSFRS